MVTVQQIAASGALCSCAHRQKPFYSTAAAAIAHIKKVKKYVEALYEEEPGKRVVETIEPQQTTFKFSIEFWPEVKGLNFRLRISKGKVSRVVIHYIVHDHTL